MWLTALLMLASAQATPVLLEGIADSGRCVTLAESPDLRVAAPPPIVPGLAPLLSFRLYEGKLRHRYDQSNLMLDDAGH